MLFKKNQHKQWTQRLFCLLLTHLLLTHEEKVSPESNWKEVPPPKKNRSKQSTTKSVHFLTHLKLIHEERKIPPKSNLGPFALTIPCPPISNHTCDATQAAIPYLHRPWTHDTIRFQGISLLPTVIICKIQWC